MTIQARVDVDIVYHDSSDTTFTVGAVSDHARPAAVGYTLSGTVATSAVTLTAAGAVTTLAIKNTGTTLLRVAGAFNVPAGRVAVLPVASSVTVAAVSSPAQYTAVWVG